MTECEFVDLILDIERALAPWRNAFPGLEVIEISIGDTHERIRQDGHRICEGYDTFGPGLIGLPKTCFAPWLFAAS